MPDSQDFDFDDRELEVIQQWKTATSGKPASGEMREGFGFQGSRRNKEIIDRWQRSQNVKGGDLPQIEEAVPTEREFSGQRLFGEFGQRDEFDPSLFEGMGDVEKQRIGEYYTGYGRGEQVDIAQGLLGTIGAGTVLSENPQQEALRGGEHKSGIDILPDRPMGQSLGVYSAQHGDLSQGGAHSGESPIGADVEGVQLGKADYARMATAILPALAGMGIAGPVGLLSPFMRPVLGSLWSSFKNRNRDPLSDPSDVLSQQESPEAWSEFSGGYGGGGAGPLGGGYGQNIGAGGGAGIGAW